MLLLLLLLRWYVRMSSKEVRTLIPNPNPNPSPSPNPNPNPNPNLRTRLLLGEHAERTEWLGPASDWWAAALCTALVCLLEAWTSQIDNLFLPIYYCAVLLLVDLR